jgi:hypothetical protein
VRAIISQLPGRRGPLDPGADYRAGLGVMTTGNTMVLSSHLTVNLAFPASMAETIPSLDTEATAGRSEV